MAITNANLPVSNGSGDAALAHIQSNRVIGSTTIATDTISNWPANFIATTGTLLSSGFIDPTTKTDFYGHLGVGNQLIIDGFCPGNADNGNTSGQVVVIKPNTEWANLIAQGVQSTSNFPFQFANFVEPQAAIWTTTSGLVGTQTTGYVWYQGVRYSIPAVATFTFTASKDTYVDVNPATGAYTYVPVANNATEPAITANCVRVAKIVTGASTVTNIYQSNYQAHTAGSNINLNTLSAGVSPTLVSGEEVQIGRIEISSGVYKPLYFLAWNATLGATQEQPIDPTYPNGGPTAILRAELAAGGMFLPWRTSTGNFIDWSSNSTTTRMLVMKDSASSWNGLAVQLKLWYYR